MIQLICFGAESAMQNLAHRVSLMLKETLIGRVASCGLLGEHGNQL